ncbi:MAG: NrsF family protein [Myxococcota bacterium]
MSNRPDFRDLPDFGEIPDPLAHTREAPAPLQPMQVDANSPNRSKTQRRRSAALALSLAWLASHLLVFGVRNDWTSLPPLYVAMQMGLPLVLGVASLIVALRGGRLGLGLSLLLITSLAVLGPLTFWAMAAAAPTPDGAHVSDRSLLGVLICIDITLVWAAFPLVCAALSLKHAFAASSRWRSALIGAACGLVAGGVMNLHCPNVARLHMTLGHGIPVLVAALAGALLMSRVTRA